RAIGGRQQLGLECEPRRAHRAQQLLGDLLAASLQGRQAGEMLIPVDLDLGRSQDPLDSRYLIKPGAAALDQGDWKSHDCRTSLIWDVNCSVSVPVVPSPPRSRVKPCPARKVRRTASSIHSAARV